MRFAVLSNIVPPSPNGQSIVLHRLLNNVPADQYYLICSEAQDRTTIIASSRLDAKYYYLGMPPRRQWASPVDMLQRAYRRLYGKSGQVENLIRLRARQISKVIQEDPCCALIVCTADLVNLPAAEIACAEHAVPFVPYIFDDYAYQMIGWERQVAQHHVQHIMTQAAKVIVTNEATAHEYQQRYRISNPVVIHNPAFIHDLNMIRSANPILDKNTFNIVYSGAIYRAHYDAFRNLIQAIEKLPKNRVKLHLFTDQPADKIAAEGGIQSECISLHPHIHQSRIGSALIEADLLFLPLAFESPIQEVLRLASPGKMGDYLATSKPILVHAPADSFVCQYFRQHQCGLVVDQPDVSILANMISDLMTGKIDVRGLGQRARERAEIDFAVDHVQTTFMECVQKVCQPSS